MIRAACGASQGPDDGGPHQSSDNILVWIARFVKSFGECYSECDRSPPAIMLSGGRSAFVLRACPFRRKGDKPSLERGARLDAAAKIPT
jgi:hypothetical protein